jgi:MFS family permease
VSFSAPFIFCIAGVGKHTLFFNHGFHWRALTRSPFKVGLKSPEHEIMAPSSNMSLKSDLEKAEPEHISPADDALSTKAWVGKADEDIEQESPHQEDYKTQTQSTEEGEGPLFRVQSKRSNIVTRVLTDPSRATSWPDPGPPPDGGRTAWTQAVLLHLSIFTTFGYTTAFGSFQTYYESTLNVAPSTISWVGSVQIWLLFFIGTFSGRALDAGYFRPVFLAGCVMQILGIFTTAEAKSFWQLFLSQGLCMGIANGLQFCPTMALASTWFSRRRAIVMGIGALGSCTGGVLFPILVQQLLPKIGFSWTIRIIGFIMVAVNVVNISFFRTRLPPRRSGPVVEWSAFREPPYALFCASAFFFFWGLYFAFFYVGSYGRNNLGMSYSDSINLLLTMVCMGFVFRLLPNYFADRLGALNVLLPWVFLCGILMFGWIGVRSPASLYVFAAIYGSGSAGIQSVWPATLASLTSDLSKAGIRMGMGFSVVSFASLTGPPLAGALIQMRDGDYLYALIWAGTSFFVGGALLVAARVAKVGWRIRCRI